MLVDAIVLTGGRSSRLDSVPKAEFVVEDGTPLGRTLLDRTLIATNCARRIVVVGHEPSAALPDGVMLVREEPPFSGPVSAIAAGVTALQRATSDAADTASDALLVLACDMPHIGLALPSLMQALTDVPNADGAIAVDAENRRQPLAAIYRTGALVRALETVAVNSFVATPQGELLAGLPVFRLLDHMSLVEIHVADDATADVDTWDDAVRLGAKPPATSTTDSATSSTPA